MIYVLIDVCLVKPVFIASAEADRQLCLQIQEAKANQSTMLCNLVSVTSYFRVQSTGLSPERLPTLLSYFSESEL